MRIGSILLLALALFAGDDPAPPLPYPVYLPVSVEVRTPLSFRQGQTGTVSGRVTWKQSAAPVTIGVVTVMLHFPLIGEEARALDVAVFALIEPSGDFVAVFVVPNLLTEGEIDLAVEAQINVFTILDAPDVPALMVVGHADEWYPSVVYR